MGANHSGRVNDQEAALGEGVFFGLGAVVKFPFSCENAPYSIVAAGSYLPQRVDFPFSLLTPSDAAATAAAPGRPLSSALNALKPGWVLYDNAYMLER